MLNYLLEEGTTPTTNWTLLIIIGVLLVALIVYRFFASKKDNERRQEMENGIKPGVRVVTRGGVYGEIVSITETTDGKVVLLATGSGVKLSYIEINILAIAQIDNKKKIVLDSMGNDITDYSEPNLDTQKEEPITEVKEETTKEEIVETKNKDVIEEAVAKEAKAKSKKASKKSSKN